MKISPELAEIAGIHAGDGYLRVRGNSYELDISGSLEEKEYYDCHVTKLFKKEFKLDLRGREFQPRNTYGIRLHKREVCDSLLKIGFPNGNKRAALRIPKDILTKDKLIKAFLRGFFDTDGNLYFARRASGKYKRFHKTRNYHPRINLTTVSKSLFKGLKKSLESININYYVFIGKPKNKRYSKTYSITIVGKQRLRQWIKEIGIKNPVKKSRFDVWEKFGFCPPHTTLEQRKKILKGKIDPNSLYAGS